jgi:hypothetical protein
VVHLWIQICEAATTLVCAVMARKNGAEVLTDELPEGEMLHKIKRQRVDRVLLYFYCGHAPILPLYRYTEEVHNGFLSVEATIFRSSDTLASLYRRYKGAVGMALLKYCACSFS